MSSANKSHENPHSIKTLSIQRLREIFDQYDINKDQKLDEKELNSLVTDIYKHYSHKKEILENDNKLIEETVKDLLKIRDLDKNGSLNFDEFIAYYDGKNIIEHSQGIKS
jgi:Ca2+-binding EF-hand superfamily protein